MAIAPEAQFGVPGKPAISTLTLAELMMGVALASTGEVRARRRKHLTWVEGTVELINFDAACATAFERVSKATTGAGRKVRGGRAIDLMIAATALAHELPLYTRNAADVRGLEGLIEIVDLS